MRQTRTLRLQALHRSRNIPTLAATRDDGGNGS
jgi:hypothetical protein